MGGGGCGDGTEKNFDLQVMGGVGMVLRKNLGPISKVPKSVTHVHVEERTALIIVYRFYCFNICTSKRLGPQVLPTLVTPLPKGTNCLYN